MKKFSTQDKTNRYIFIFGKVIDLYTHYILHIMIRGKLQTPPNSSHLANTLHYGIYQKNNSADPLAETFVHSPTPSSGTIQRPAAPPAPY